MTLDIITSDLIAPAKHGFFGRSGGASSGVFHGLNCGHGSSDQSQAVALNRVRVAQALGIDPENLMGVTQVHSADVTVLRDAVPDRPRGDAIVTDKPGLALSILTADCAPVLFADTEAGVIGAAHAGWKGALAGVLEATIEAMETLGAERGRIVAAIGPTISQKSYEVGPEFVDAFIAEDDRALRFFAGGEGDRMQFDLPGYVLWRLREAGVRNAEWTRHCTYADPDRFFSYRRATHRREADYGRLISAICL
ncbi:peptidoglycan editing factor PgeF [Ponticoccus sp. SC2-23]|uniref:peptidoglycan editing factor PgeF n=1 Tax=Alexandriicola marinus TaxID=2081710 RepID=UPI000FD8D3C0|nr:peptidoglycan editing factor PgeF [Alexandriicola marinus]MBM1220050.1 peptidoglycan editing factor PgeF [Ponticoccus sp. SC6-9]MBM1224736.1 peptidoglycan editing factor PgeF [Ponticoccus sp. SC6-15]MBM1228249.1 peptidoglycan editing factor PgeF [Ponticoccus sp. SC6-38]MBM1234113.1 peptidoglycan editing factor PgeF [Ponticoccus sp. SC6-45]MBM1238751.1 peptidoglycan editing factor PgeF [Ponticoccus sp. SC6-49]MBM1242532.1 peptidoglycan editing factor PgeF [Ponticoccus sp. SC2-64]MBM1247637